jgi:Tfp pilus assembly protein PilV
VLVALVTALFLTLALAHLRGRAEASSAVSEREVNGGTSMSPQWMASASRSETCRNARNGYRYYLAAEKRWRQKMGRGSVSSTSANSSDKAHPRFSCSWTRRAASLVRARAHSAKLAYYRWRDEWAWRAWLPAKWYRIARCETGVRWDWDSGTYVSAFGIYRPAYAQFAGYIGQRSWDAPGVRTPREQFGVALAIWRRYGFSGWGCRNA